MVHRHDRLALRWVEDDALGGLLEELCSLLQARYMRVRSLALVLITDQNPADPLASWFLRGSVPRVELPRRCLLVFVYGLLRDTEDSSTLL